MSLPNLRFPEFRDIPEWENKRLGDISAFIKERILLKQLTLSSYISTENILPDYGGITIASKLPPSGTATHFKKYDILISNIRPYLKKVWFSDKDGGASNDVIVIRSKTKISHQYLAFLLKNDEFINYVMKGAKGVKMPRGDISLMREYPVATPSIAEQQKIANCLSSIDELITAQTQKLDTLKMHKKGLMQQLFPAEGEAVPKLRFKEFSDEWTTHKIGDFIESYKGGAALTPSDFVSFSDYEVIPKKAISHGAWLKIDIENPTCCNEKFFKENTQSVVDSTYLITTLRDLVPSGPSIGYIVKYTGSKKYLLAQGVYGLKPKKTIIADFLIQFSNTDKYRRMMKAAMVGSTQVHIRNTVYLSLPITIPSLEEQLRVADCLASVDALIVAQAQKIEALKQHKKGLMQQLFPAAEEVDA